MLNANRLRELLHYEPETGVFTWLAKTGSCAAGEIAGGCNNKGYICIRLDRALYRAHRLAWLYMTGKWPADQVDHINVVRDDNRWVNLREANNSQNVANGKLRRSNVSGFKGVDWHKRQGKWRAQINANQKCIHLGYFDDPAAAHAAYIDAARAQFGEFAREA